MKLAFSNIAWDAAEESQVLDILSEAQISGLEIAPTKLWPNWDGATAIAARQIGEQYRKAGFIVPALQAILFDRPNLTLFGDHAVRAALLEHIETVADIAAGLGARTLVFGAPRNRDPGNLSPEDAMTAAVSVFRKAGALCAAHGVWLGIEANPPIYECRFITRWFEAAELVRRCDSPGVRLHLDAACTALAGDDLAEAVAATADILAHVHISEPQLGSFENPHVDHIGFGMALRRAGYDGWCSVEMRRSGNPLTALRHAVAFAKSCYV